MAPVESSALSQPLTWPLALYSAQLLLFGPLTFTIVRTIRRAAKSIPPSSSTRAQIPVRHRHAIIFATLAVLSLASVSTFGVAWRVLSYLHWAENKNHAIPGNLWSGWYGTGEDGVGYWRLGDWVKDMGLDGGVDRLGFAIGNAEESAWTGQWFMGLVAVAFFMTVEGYRRNLSSRVTTSFVLLAQFFSLGFSLSLFFVTLLYTPVTFHRTSSFKPDTHILPVPFRYWLPVIGSFALLFSAPTLLAGRIATSSLKLTDNTGLILGATFVTFLSQINVGHRPSLSAHQSSRKIFATLRWLSLPIFWKQLLKIGSAETAPKHSSVYDFLLHPLAKHNDDSEGFTASLKNAAHSLRFVSANPIISATSSDVLFTILSLCVWAFVRNLSVDDMLDYRVPIPFLQSYWKKEVVPIVKDVASDKEDESIEVKPPPTTPGKRGRGRPKKNGDVAAASSTASTTSSTGTLRRSTRRRTQVQPDSEPEDDFQPSPRLSEEVAHTETDGSATEDVVAGGEAAALGLFLTFIGGLGELAASVLGAEVVGSSVDGD